MGSLKSVLAAGILAVAATSASAADLLLPPPLPEPIDVFAGGWYLRGDVGVGFTQIGRTVGRDVSTPPFPFAYRTVEDKVEDQVFVGAGVGYQFNSWFRADVTGEYRTKTGYSFLYEDTTFGPVNAYNQTRTHFSTVVGLVNGYVDLGTWWGVTPFVGAGVGVAHHIFDVTTDTGLGSSTGGFGIGPAVDRTNFAWALHAGLGYSVTPGLTLEFAYRYLNMGDSKLGTVVCLPAAACSLRTDYRVRDLESHDFKIGMRWLLAAPVAYEPPPLIAKY